MGVYLVFRSLPEDQSPGDPIPVVAAFLIKPAVNIKDGTSTALHMVPGALIRPRIAGSTSARSLIGFGDSRGRNLYDTDSHRKDGEFQPETTAREYLTVQPSVCRPLSHSFLLSIQLSRNT